MKRTFFSAISVVILCAQARGQIAGEVAVPGQETKTIPYGGSEVFRFLLHKKGLEPITNPDAALGAPSETVIIILGDSRNLQLPDGSALREFVEKGGALLIATDVSNRQGAAGNRGWGPWFGIDISGTHLTGAPANCYRKIEGRPYVLPNHGNGARNSPREIMAGIEDHGDNALATDHPSEMIAVEPRGLLLKELARYPRGTRRLTDRGAVTGPFAISLEVKAAGISTGPGRTIAIADHSVFVNGMMGFVRDEDVENKYRFDNANFRFTNQTIDWLKGGYDQPRTQCLFIEDGQVIDKFAIPIPQIPPPPIPDIPPDVLANILLNHSNGLINELQEKNFFNRTLEQLFGMPRILRWFLFIVTVFFVFQCLRFLARGRNKIEPIATLTPAVQAGLQPKGGVLRQRTAAQIEVGNLYEAAGRRVRERFDVLGGRPASSGEMPPILTASDLPDAPMLHQTVQRLWIIGYGAEPRAVPPNDWDRVNALLERVTTRAARGDWSFGQVVG